MILEHKGEAISFIFSHVTVEHFTHPLSRAALAIILGQPDDSWDPVVLFDRVDDPALKSYLASLLASRYEISRTWAVIGSEPDVADPRKIAEDAILRLKTEELDRRIEEAYRRLKAAGAHGEGVAKYQEEMLSLQKEKLALRGKPLS